MQIRIWGGPSFCIHPPYHFSRVRHVDSGKCSTITLSSSLGLHGTFTSFFSIHKKTKKLFYLPQNIQNITHNYIKFEKKKKKKEKKDAQI